MLDTIDIFEQIKERPESEIITDSFLQVKDNLIEEVALYINKNAPALQSAPASGIRKKGGFSRKAQQKNIPAQRKESRPSGESLALRVILKLILLLLATRY